MKIEKKDFLKSLEIYEKAAELAKKLANIKYEPNNNRAIFVDEMEILDDSIEFLLVQHFEFKETLGYINISYDDLYNEEKAIAKAKDTIKKEKEAKIAKKYYSKILLPLYREVIKITCECCK